MSQFWIAAITTCALVQAQDTSPRKFVADFCKRDFDGGQLVDNGRKEMGKLFREPLGPITSIMVVRDFAVSKPVLENSETSFLIDYRPIGRFDPSTMKFEILPPSLEVRGELRVMSAASSDRAKDTSRQWLFVGSILNPYVSLSSAMQYVTEIINHSKDQAVSARARRILNTLKTLR